MLPPLASMRIRYPRRMLCTSLWMNSWEWPPTLLSMSGSEQDDWSPPICDGDAKTWLIGGDQSEHPIPLPVCSSEVLVGPLGAICPVPDTQDRAAERTSCLHSLRIETTSFCLVAKGASVSADCWCLRTGCRDPAIPQMIQQDASILTLGADPWSSRSVTVCYRIVCIKRRRKIVDRGCGTIEIRVLSLGCIPVWRIPISRHCCLVVRRGISLLTASSVMLRTLDWSVKVLSILSHPLSFFYRKLLFLKFSH